MISAKLEEGLVIEAVVARLQRMAQLHAARLSREQPEEGGDILAVELPARLKLPEDRPEFGPKHGKSLADEIGDRVRAFRQPGPRDAEARRLDRELEVVGHGRRPIFPAF